MQRSANQIRVQVAEMRNRHSEREEVARQMEPLNKLVSNALSALVQVTKVDPDRFEFGYRVSQMLLRKSPESFFKGLQSLISEHVYSANEALLVALGAAINHQLPAQLVKQFSESLGLGDEFNNMWQRVQPGAAATSAAMEPAGIQPLSGSFSGALAQHKLAS